MAMGLMGLALDMVAQWHLEDCSEDVQVARFGIHLQMANPEFLLILMHRSLPDACRLRGVPIPGTEHQIERNARGLGRGLEVGYLLYWENCLLHWRCNFTPVGYRTMSQG